MEKLVFKVEDFKHEKFNSLSPDAQEAVYATLNFAANRANAKLEKWLAEPASISDGYHTFGELYEHRCLLFIKLAIHSGLPCAWKPHYPGWPVLFLETPAGQISYHFMEKFLPIVEANVARDDDYKWDGHESKDVIERLERTWK